MKDKLALLGFVVAVVGLGIAIGLLTAPGAWYAALAKPSFQPPAWIFGPVWTALYVLIAIAGWRVWRAGWRNLIGLWFAQMALNFLWSPLFFGAHRIALALGIISLLLATILAFMALAARRDRWAVILFAPYALWVGFATILNAAIWKLNS